MYCHRSSILKRVVVTLKLLLFFEYIDNILVEGYTIPRITTNNDRRYQHHKVNRYTLLFAQQKEKQSRGTSAAVITKKTDTVDDDDDDEKPAGIVGAQFFGGDKQKEEFYDPVAEMEAGLDLLSSKNSSSRYNRFEDRLVFPDSFVGSVAESIQDQINHVLFEDEPLRTSIPTCTFSDRMIWETTFPKTATTPIQELGNALNFYRRLNVAIICGNTLETSTTTVKDVQLRWEISVLWPTIWEPRILLTGCSTLSIDTTSNQVIQQNDVLDGDLFSTIFRQFVPRFWDMYHIGMTPAAEVAPILAPTVANRRNLFASYQIQELPPRIVVQPTIYDTDRDDANASVLPNHAFSCVIKTMGPEKQFYTPVTGVQVRLIPMKQQENSSSQRLQIQWYIPIATEYVSNIVLQLPGSDNEITEVEQRQPSCNYTYVPRRLVATVPFGGSAQDSEVTKIRKNLYDQVIKDGYTPKIDTSSGRPVFFFTMNSIKACYTNEGLGMAVYEWRPQFTRPNEIGIELELK